ncbi:C-compound and carbohydrate metabolism [Rhodopirellula islandica]|uniref:C-compound and carbohydrate metabolism n=1 Tax=Rhodopirellula islandica TaxID=595434 RepID=A0A0J1ENT0_RHOIS|nr:cupin domain-containing protein [Rhodopirellula islandica]KLU07149.1 C-compound and carbohydrate metabolism [Rhodopirellula islandica]
MKPQRMHANPANQRATPGPSQPELVDLTRIEPVECPCGLARRAFADSPHFPGTLHLTQISLDAQTHFHRDHTEIYVILNCDADAAIELDGELHPVRPLMSILIPPQVKHRAVGKMEVLIVCTPEFDSADEHFGDPAVKSAKNSTVP